MSEPPFKRFEWVTPGELARSSAPHYVDNDKDQNMDEASIEFLVHNGLRNIISLNSVKLTAPVVKKLEQKGISYFHSPIPDFKAPTLAQLGEIHKNFEEKKKSHKPSLVYCGYGHGRTGTIVSALQIYNGRRFPDHKAYDVNHVEKEEQRAVLDQLQRSLG